VQVGDKIKYQDQSSGPNQSAGNIAYINQSGDDNNGKQDQMGSLNDALIDQFGDDNTAKQNKQDH
jgi:hypothetical protein